MATIPEDKLSELLECFDSIDGDGSGYLEKNEIQKALAIVGFNKPNYEIRDIMQEFDVKNNDERIDFEEFKLLYSNLLEKDFGSLLRNSLRTVRDAEDYGSRCCQGSYDTKHSIRMEEQMAFADWINRHLETDPQCTNYLPFHPEGRDLFSKCRDGVILCKILNQAMPDTVDERAINYGTNLSLYKKLENVTLALNSARAIGCNVVNIGASDIERGIEHLTLGLLWQIIKVALLNSINIKDHAEIALLTGENESLSDIRGLAPEDILIRWVNFHLEKAGTYKRIRNFSEDIKDCEAYAFLLSQISSKDVLCNLHSPNSIMEEFDSMKRADMILENADIMKARNFVSAADIVQGNEKLNLAFVASLFHLYPALKSSNGGAHFGEELNLLGEEMNIPEETSEEKMYRYWINSLGLNPRVYYLYKDLQDSLIIFQLYDIIQPDTVNWNKVNKNFSKLKRKFQLIENANYAVALGIENKFSLVGIEGYDIVEGKDTLTLALLWQLLRAYNLSVLNKIAVAAGKEIEESDILVWVNAKLSKKPQTGMNSRSTSSTPSSTLNRHKLSQSVSVNDLSDTERSISSFSDSKLKNGKLLIQLIENIRPRTVDKKMITDDAMANAKYAISMARKIGARVYAQPEDIVDLKGKMIMTLLASLMVTDYQRVTRK